MLRKILHSFALAFANIRSNLFHTLLSVLGIVIGVAALVSILSLIDGMEKFARDQISSTTSLNGILIQSEVYKTVNDIRLRKDTVDVFNYSDYIRLAGKLSRPVKPYIRSSSSREVVYSSTGVKLGVNVLATGSSLQPGIENPQRDIFTDLDVEEKKPFVLVNNAFVKAVQAKTDLEVIGKEIVFNDKSFVIKGVLSAKRESPQLYYPITLLSENELQANPPELIFEVEKTEDVLLLKDEMNDWLKANFKNAATDFRVLTNDYRLEQATKGFLLFRVIMGLIVGISVIVGGIGVMNVLVISVTERTAEIGLRKAAGANRRDIILLFLTESITISAFGSVLGVIAGVLGTMLIIPVIKAITDVHFQAAYTWNTMIIISIISLLVGVIFGTYPAIRASRLDPVEAIRHE